MCMQYNYKNLKANFSKQMLEKLLVKDKYSFRDLQRKYHYNERLWSKLAHEYNIDKPQHVSHHIKQLPMQEIIDLYVNQLKSARSIAAKYGVTHGCIIKRLREYNINIREFCDIEYYKNRNHKNPAEPYIDNTGYLRHNNERLHRKIVQQEIGRKLEHDEVVHHLDGNKLNNDLNNLVIFPDNRSHLLYHAQEWTNDPYEFIHYYNNTLMNTVFNNEWMYHQYITLNKSMAQISRETGISRPTVQKQLKIFNLYNLRKCSMNQFS